MPIVSWLIYDGLPRFPFWYLTLGIQKPEFFLPIVLGFAMRAIGFPLAGFLGGYAAQRTAVTLPKEEVVKLTELERKILDYITAHQHKIRISKCAKELDIGDEKVEKALKSLEEKGLLKKR